MSALSCYPAALLTLVQLSINLASYANAELGPPWAIIQANSKGGGGPDSVYIGMFRICWKSANAVSCGPFGLGLSIGAPVFKAMLGRIKLTSVMCTDKTVMQGGDAWTAVMPPTLVTATYPLVGLGKQVTKDAGRTHLKAAQPHLYSRSLQHLCGQRHDLRRLALIYPSDRRSVNAVLPHSQSSSLS